MWYSDAAPWARVSCRFLFCFWLSSRSMSQQGLKWSKYDSFYYIFWLSDTLATKLALVIPCNHHKPECPVKKMDDCIQGQGHNEGSKWYLSRYFLKQQTFCFQTWYCDAALWVGVSCKKIDLLFLRSRSLQELIWSKYDNCYSSCCTADPSATKLGLIVNYRKPECYKKKLDCYVQGQGHSKISKCQWMFVQMISSETLTFHYHPLWARLSFRKIGLLSSGWMSQLRIIW